LGQVEGGKMINQKENTLHQGYITLATGPRTYLEMAVNLMLSLKHNDPKRQTCVVLDEGTSLPDEFKPFIDHVAYLSPREGFHGCLNKLRLSELSPFEESMFVDADCLLVKADMDRHWSKFQAAGFNIAGGKVTNGRWYDFDINEAITTIGIPYMVKMNSGVFYFRKGEETEKFFATTHLLVSQHKNLLGSFHRNRLQLADEPFIGAALGVHNMVPISYTPNEGSIMITTVNSSQASFDPIQRVSSILKHDDFLLRGRFFPRKKVKHSPSFAHFVKLKPRAVYQSCADTLRDQYGLPPYLMK
jgi:hypothetical protein